MISRGVVKVSLKALNTHIFGGQAKSHTVTVICLPDHGLKSVDLDLTYKAMIYLQVWNLLIDLQPTYRSMIYLQIYNLLAST
jgi:hypothetical protein